MTPAVAELKEKVTEQEKAIAELKLALRKQQAEFAARLKR